jgi:DNA-binding transcriptional MerR regulator
MSKAADAFRTISEVAAELAVPKHVLRFWEAKFPQIRPMKRGGGRRYYRPGDMELLRGIRHLLHAEGYTIKGVQKILREQGVDVVKAASRTVTGAGEAEPRTRRSGPRPVHEPAEVRAAAAATSSGSGPGDAAPASREPSRADLVARLVAELEACRSLLTADIEAAPARAPRRARALRG